MTEQGAKRSNSLVKLLACFRLCRLESITARCVKRVECFAGTQGTCLFFGVHFCAGYQLHPSTPWSENGRRGSFRLAQGQTPSGSRCGHWLRVASTNCRLMMMHTSGPKTPILLKVHLICAV